MHSILVVEDDPDVRELLAEILRDAGYVVLEAEHGAHALEILQKLQEHPCVVLLDLMMPVMSGQEMLAKLRENDSYRSLPIIVISAIGNRDLVPKTDAFVAKPLDVPRLLQAVRQFCPVT